MVKYNLQLAHSRLHISFQAVGTQETVRSLITVSLASGRGRLTHDAALASVNEGCTTS